MIDLKRAHQNAVNKGFWEDCQTGDERVKAIPEKIALIHSEASEALECYRDKDMVTAINTTYAVGKPEGFPSELADIVIRVADLAGALGIDLEHEISIKMDYNETRPHKHGKVC